MVGMGRFGRFLASFLLDQGCEIIATDLGGGGEGEEMKRLKKRRRFSYLENLDLEGVLTCSPDLLLPSVSILSFEEVMTKICKLPIPPSTLFVDVCSVKMHPKKVFFASLPENVDFLNTHPMFGPDSARGGMGGLPLVFEKSRISEKNAGKCREFLGFFERSGCRLLQISCANHDKIAANSQFLAHLAGRVLGRVGVQRSAMDTAGFRALLGVVENAEKDSFELFKGLFEMNPEAKKLLKEVKMSLGEVEAALEEKEVDPDFTRPSTPPEGPPSSSPPSLLSPLALSLEASSTVALHQKAQQMKKEGKEVVASLCVGEPDFLPPPSVLKNLEKAPVRYTAVQGSAELRAAISDDYWKRKGVRFCPSSEVLVSAGGKAAIYASLLALVGKGDRVALPVPAWPSFEGIVKMCGGEVEKILLRSEEGYKLTPENLRKTLKNNTKILILCNPSNPTGAFLNEENLMQIAQVLKEENFKNILVLADEIYEKLVFSGSHFSFSALPGMKGRTLTIGGVSKGEGMTGFRVGWALGPQQIIENATKIQGQITSCASSVSQFASSLALRTEREWYEKNLEELRKKRDFIVAFLNSLSGVCCPVPEGAFYCMPDFSVFMRDKKIRNIQELSEKLVEEEGVVLVPGSGFCCPSSSALRISFAASWEDLRKAAEKIKRFCEK